MNYIFLARRRRESNIRLTRNSGPKGLARFLQRSVRKNRDNRNCRVEAIVIIPEFK